MGLRDRAKRLEQEARDDLASFELLDSSRYYFVPGGELYMFCYDCIGENPPDWPEPPELLKKVCEARDPAVALEEVWSKAIADIFPFSREVLINERRLEPRSIVEGKGPYEQGTEDLCE
jgi:hypothetical protein